MVKRLTQRGIKSIYLVCDIINETMVELTDKTVVVTEFLKNQYPVDLHSKIHVIHDGIEHSQDQKDYYRADTGSRFHPLNAALITSANLERLPQIGSPPPWLHVAIVGRYPKQREIMKRLQQIKWACMAKKRNKSELFSYIQFLCETRISRFAWSEETAYRCMRNADIGILPINAESDPIHNLLAPSWKLKSENRLTMKMAMGLPVIATPIPAYENVIKHGENGFLARSASDWQACLSMLRDPARRQQVGNAARKSVIETFSMESQSVMLASVIESLLMSKQNTTSFDHAN